MLGDFGHPYLNPNKKPEKFQSKPRGIDPTKFSGTNFCENDRIPSPDAVINGVGSHKMLFIPFIIWVFRQIPNQNQPYQQQKHPHKQKTQFSFPPLQPLGY